MGSLCDQCSGLCCRYFALPIDNPTTVRDYDNIRWYLLHENVVVFIEKKQWFIGVLTRCKHLGPDNRCGIYETRPRICREFSTENCDYHGGDYGFEKLFTSGEQLRTYAEEKLNANRKGKRRISLIPRPRPRKPRMKRLVANGQLVGLSLPVIAP
jgi:Fe-S-cluster containining protein